MSSEELKKEWEEQFDYDFVKINGENTIKIMKIYLKSFISSLLAKQQEEFVKMIDEIEPYSLGDDSANRGYLQALADIKSKLNI
jgi:hypothetical protein